MTGDGRADLRLERVVKGPCRPFMPASFVSDIGLVKKVREQTISSHRDPLTIVAGHGGGQKGYRVSVSNWQSTSKAIFEGPKVLMLCKNWSNVLGWTSRSVETEFWKRRKREFVASICTEHDGSD